jgi:hypothetical protein
MPAEVKAIRETAAGQLGDEREQTEGEPSEKPLVSPCEIHPTKVCAPQRTLVKPRR